MLIRVITATVGATGKMTLPASVRKALKLVGKHQIIRFELCEDGSAKIYPIVDALDLKGVFADPSRPYDPKEREKAWGKATKALPRKPRRCI